MSVSARLAGWLRHMADRIDRGEAPKSTGFSLAFETGNEITERAWAWKAGHPDRPGMTVYLDE